MKTRKAIEAIVAKAKVSDGPWVDEDAAVPDKEEKPKKAKTKSPAKKAAKKAEAGE